MTTVFNMVLVAIESWVGWWLSGIAFFVELIEAIPVLGTAVRWILNFVTWLVWTIIAIPDAILGLLGIKPEKKLRVCTIILRDEKGSAVASSDYAVALLQLAADIYKRDANVRIVHYGPFQYDTGFKGGEIVTSQWVKVDDEPSDADLLEPPCNGGGAAAEWWLTGTRFQRKVTTLCFYGAWRRVLGYGAPVTCFIVREVPEAGGCALWITDYATINRGDLPLSSARTLAHEVGHASNLWHICVDGARRNLMATKEECTPDSTLEPDTADPRIDTWQVLLIRASKHATYF